MEKGRVIFKILKGKLTGKIALGRPRHRREDNIRTNLDEIGVNMRNWTDSASDICY